MPSVKSDHLLQARTWSWTNIKVGQEPNMA
jgi:hypothetical protein